MKLRDAITEYSKWIAALWGAAARGTIMPNEAYDMMGQLQAHIRAWIGEDLLNKEL